jgi:hypothetical protein
MTLVFRNNPEAAVQCALELSKKLKAHLDLSVRTCASLHQPSNIRGAP